MFSVCREVAPVSDRRMGKPRGPATSANGGRVRAVDHAGRRPALRLAAIALLFFAAPSPFAAERVLRVAADPNNLPFSNERREGFENRLAELIAAELGATLEYMWWPQRRGFFRETVGSGRADIVMGVPERFERLLTTRAYYTSTYVFVRRVGTPEIRSFDDPALRQLTIGVQLAGDDGVNTPPAHALALRGMVDNVRGFTLYGDYAEESPPAAIVAAVARREVDVAVAWGPMAGYFAPRQQPPLALAPVEPCDCPSLRFVFPIAVGVARGQPALRDEIDAVLGRRAAEIERLLDEFNVPRVTSSVAAKGGSGDAAQ